MGLASGGRPDAVRVMTLASLRWVLRNRAYTPYYLIRYWRYLLLRLRHPEVITTGMVFLDRDVQFVLRPGYGRLIIGRWVHIGAGTAIRCHEGTLRIGDHCVLGRRDSLNCYLDLELGDSVLMADDVFVSDFDHRHDRLDVPIMKQGIVKAAVSIGADTWLGTKVTVTRGVRIGPSCIVGANAVVTRDLPARSVAVGAPARVVRTRREEP
jgi:acetyltransferase-like isoleucine patch superfamily enzyme